MLHGCDVTCTLVVAVAALNQERHGSLDLVLRRIGKVQFPKILFSLTHDQTYPRIMIVPVDQLPNLGCLCKLW